jgi:hypothetical protein
MGTKVPKKEVAAGAAATVSAHMDCSGNHELPPKCDFDVVQKMNATTFARRYREKRPFLLRGGAKLWAEKRDWSLDGLQGDFGEQPVAVGCDSDQVTSVGAWSERTMPFKDALGDSGCKRATVFDRSLFRKTGLRTLATTADLHPEWFFAGREQFYQDIDALLMIGAQSSGTPFHAHHCAYNLLFEGNKTWFAHGPEQPAVDTNMRSMSDWANKSSSAGLLTCVQESMDLVYMPAGWKHATLCTGVNIGVSLQVHPKHDRERLSTLQLKSYQQAAALNPTHSTAWQRLGVLHMEGGRWKEGIESYRKHIAINPTHVRALVELGASVLQGGRGGAAAARNLFEKAISLEPQNFLAHYGMADLGIRTKDFDAAMKSFETSLSAPVVSKLPVHRTMVRTSYAQLCRLYFLRKNLKKAINTACREALVQFPADEALTFCCVSAMRARAKKKQGRGKTTEKKGLKLREKGNVLLSAALALHPESTRLRSLA